MIWGIFFDPVVTNGCMPLPCAFSNTDVLLVPSLPPGRWAPACKKGDGHKKKAKQTKKENEEEKNEEKPGVTKKGKGKKKVAAPKKATAWRAHGSHISACLS